MGNGRALGHASVFEGRRKDPFGCRLLLPPPMFIGRWDIGIGMKGCWWQNVMTDE
jgi:hypothetical protein